jgi:hypothetical protein
LFRADKRSCEVDAVVTNPIQLDASLPIQLAKPVATTSGNDSSQGSFATALQNAVNSNASAKTSSLAKAETQPKASQEEGARSLQQMLSPVSVPLAPNPLAPAPKVENPKLPFASLPGKVGKENVSQSEGVQPSPANDTWQQPTTPLVFSMRVPGTRGDKPSATPPSSPAPVSPDSPAGTSQGFTNPADPILGSTQSVSLTPPVLFATPCATGEPQLFASPAANATADSSMTQPQFEAALAATSIPGATVPDASSVTPKSTKTAVDTQPHPAEITPQRPAAPALLPDPGMATATAALLPRVGLPIADKPPRVVDPEARRVGSLPLREAISTVPVSPEVPKAIGVPVQFKSAATGITVPLSDFANTASREKATAADADTAPQPATPAADSPLPPLQMDAQPVDVQTAGVVAVIPPSTGQAPGSQASATSPGDAPLQHPIQTSAEAPTGSAGLVQTARVVEGIAQSEMHIGFRTPAFGSVEVHTAVRDTQLGLAVSSERGDLRGFLAQEVPGLQTVFHQQGLQFDQIRFMAPGSGTGTGFTGGSDSHQDSGNGRGSRSWFSQDVTPEPDTATSEIQPSTVRLSVQA